MSDPDLFARVGAIVDEVLFPGADLYTLDQIAERAGTDPGVARRVWRALGFADPRPDDRVGGEMDVAVLRRAVQPRRGPDDVEVLIRQTRIMAAAVARITDLWVDQFRVGLDAVDSGRLRDRQLDDRLRKWAEEFDERTMWMLNYMHRRLYAAGLRREIANRSSGGETAQTAVFADLVGFTTLTERLDPFELSALIGSFEAIAYDTVAQHGGRVVKTIGDEVLFAAHDPLHGVETAEDLIVRSGREDLPALRVGLDHGPAVWFEGDLFGSTVNRASRLVAEATPGSLVATTDFAEGVPDRRWVELGPRHLKGFGTARLSALVPVT